MILFVANAVREGPGSASLLNEWLLVALLIAAAWTFPSRVAIGIALLTSVLWAVVEWQAAIGISRLPGQLVRMTVAACLVASFCRLRDKLSQAERISRIDSLTGLPNRQALIDAMEAELSRAKRFGRPFSLALLDCDGFKGINDRSGHLAGDAVLRRIGDSLRGNPRPFDCAGRWGGDEFLVVLSEVNHLDAEVLAERLRAAIRHEVEREYPMLAFSLGVVTFADVNLGWQDCLQRVDEAMYSAKRAGRDETRFDVVE